LDLSRNNHQHTGFKDQTLVKLVQRCRGLRKTGRDGEGLKRTAILRSSQQHLGNTSESENCICPGGTMRKVEFKERENRPCSSFPLPSDLLMLPTGPS
jgi:hypothetical protein